MAGGARGGAEELGDRDFAVKNLLDERFDFSAGDQPDDR